MDFSLSDEQRMIADTMAQVLGDHHRRLPTPQESAGLWQAMAGLGLLGLPFPVHAGGSGLAVSDMIFALIETGRSATQVPLIATVLLPALCLRGTGHGALPPALIAGIVAGQMQLGAAIDDSGDTPMQAMQEPGGYRLSGRKVACLGADVAAQLLIVATSGTGAGVFLVPADAPGLELERYNLVDGRGAADVTCNGLRLPDKARIGGSDLAALLSDGGALALAADALGAMHRINELTLEHLKTRHQFGQPIGRFQVLQHRMVDMVHETEHLTSLVFMAAKACDGPDATDRARSVSRLKRHLAMRIRPAAASALQLHGGIGMTADYVLGSLVKRVLVADMLFGTAEDHAARLRGLLAAEYTEPTPA